jgi:uncharacterized membrane protein YhaH (DUF805 family)
MTGNWRLLFVEVQGRISRKGFWNGTLILLAVYLSIFVTLLAFWRDDFLAEPSALWIRRLTFGTDVLLAWPAFAVTAKRQHDRGQRPWLAWTGLVTTLGYSALELAGYTETAAGLTTLGMAALSLMVIFVVFVVIELGIRKGTPGVNAYGPDPLEAS